MVSVNKGYHTCGGALINENWVLSSGMCSASKVLIRLGEHNLRRNEGTEQWLEHRINRLLLIAFLFFLRIMSFLTIQHPNFRWYRTYQWWGYNGKELVMNNIALFNNGFKTVTLRIVTLRNENLNLGLLKRFKLYYISYMILLEPLPSFINS